MWQEEARQWLRDVLPAANGLDIEVARERGWGAVWKLTADIWNRSGDDEVENDRGPAPSIS